MTNKFYSEAICMTLLQNYVLTNRRVKGMTVLPFYKFASDERYFMITVHMEDCTVKAYTNANIVHIDSNERMNVQLDTLQISEQKEMYSKIIRYLHDNKK